MIGYYVHHVGRGHLHRAATVAHELADGPEEVTGLSSLPRPSGWPGEWVQLERDDCADAPLDPTAGGVLHWAPAGDAGLVARMHRISEWIAAARPRLVVCDVSVEVALLCRLHGVRVVGVVLPGDRGDGAHRLGRAIADLLVAFWPPEATGMVDGLTPRDAERLACVGAVSRHAVAASPTGPPADSRARGDRSVVVLAGEGGGGLGADVLDRARATSPGWSWSVLGGPAGTWVDDPRPALLGADVVVTHAGQNALAEVAAARRPAIVVPQERPHREQEFTARVLAGDRWPALVETSPATADWPSLLAEAGRLPPDGWGAWCDGLGARRFAQLLVAGPSAGDGTQ